MVCFYLFKVLDYSVFFIAVIVVVVVGVASLYKCLLFTDFLLYDLFHSVYVTIFDFFFVDWQ